jgi:hypothetical protein
MQLKRSFILLLSLTIAFPANAIASSGERIDAERAFFRNIVQSQNLLREYGTPISAEGEKSPANVAFGGGGEPGSVHFSLRGLKGWGLQSSNIGAFPKCSDSNDLECMKVMRARSYQATLPPCFTSQESDCISRLAVALQDGTIEDALPVQEMPVSPRDYPDLTRFKPFAGDPEVNLPAGGNKWVWAFPKYSHSAGRLFMPSVTLWQEVAINSMQDNYKYPNPNAWISLSPAGAETLDGSNAIRMAMGPNFQLRYETFKQADQFILEFRTSVPWTTWNKASLTDMSIGFERSDKDYLYSIKGRPSLIPEVGKNIKITKDNFDDMKRLASGNFSCSNPDDLATCRGVIYVGGKGGISDESFDRLESIEPFTDRKSEGLAYFWLVQTSIETRYSPKVEQCTKSVAREQPAGTISSNATLQQDGPPSWSDTEQSFTYRVGALSKLAEGTDFKGTYTFQLSTELAECIWGSTPTSQSLQVQILNSDMKPQVITSSAMKIGKSFVFNASGFHFSSPRIVISSKSEDKSKTQTSEVVQASIPTKNTISTIKCRQGKVEKTYKRRSCPTGWKKLP